MLEYLVWEDGRALVHLKDNTTMSIITPEASRISTQLMLVAWVDSGRAIPNTDNFDPPDGKYEVAFLDWEHRAPMDGVIVGEWEKDVHPAHRDIPGWSLYWVTEEQIADYIEKVGVK